MNEVRAIRSRTNEAVRMLLFSPLKKVESKIQKRIRLSLTKNNNWYTEVILRCLPGEQPVCLSAEIDASPGFDGYGNQWHFSGNISEMCGVWVL